MRFPHDDTFSDERPRYSFRFCCEDCAMFDVPRQRCAHGFPTEEHRRDRYADQQMPLAFCKEFELS